ncbi:cytochrome b [Aquihabitans sp. G128]|uniref:cytochrome bc1 complex cytochrome b subunit n=1 Tax=Aquihabitans sp. G128 TaxID=2849779 RepID=UPI001C2385AB|nr:cytochrome b [Aquihabitans sp. G128]QXC61531.1 cytochrome b [Aquihabitans sp. G128]
MSKQTPPLPKVTPSAKAKAASSRTATFKGARWVDDRLGGAKFARTALNKVFPDHWSFMIGELSLYSFVVLLLTGVYLTFFFDASSEKVIYDGSYAALRGVEMTHAYKSSLDLSFDVRAGLLMRQIHHWAALLFLATMVVHLARVFFTGAFRKPRELNWMVGCTLLILAIFNGFAGYSLLDDQLSGTGLRIAYSIALSIPLVGTWVTSLLFGGEFPGPDIIERLYVIHILLIPAAITVLLGVHLFIIVRQKHTQFPGPGRREDNVVGERVFPTYAAKAIGLFFLTVSVLCLLGGLVQINPIWIYGPFDPAEVSAASQPDWYMGWLDGALRIMPGWEVRLFGFELPNPFFPAVLLAGATFGLLYAWPFLEARHARPRHPPPRRPAPPAAGAHRPGRRHHRLLQHLLPGRRRRRALHHVRPVGELGAVDVPVRAVHPAAHRGVGDLPALQGAVGPRRLAHRQQGALAGDPGPAAPRARQGPRRPPRRRTARRGRRRRTGRHRRRLSPTGTDAQLEQVGWMRQRLRRVPAKRATRSPGSRRSSPTSTWCSQLVTSTV